MSSFQLTGYLKVKGEMQRISEKFSKRDFVINEVSGQYPQLIQFQLIQDRCFILDDAIVGTEVTVYFNLRGREWQSPQGEVKYFNTLEAWKLELKSPPPAQTNRPDTDVTTFSLGESDDLPF